MKLFNKNLLAFLALISLAVVGCKDNRSEAPSDVASISEQEEGSQSVSISTVDYTEEAKLLLDYENKVFVRDGIAKATLKTPIDGDTAHFYTQNGSESETIKARFFGIDTPESTGAVQPYGKGASNFTKHILEEAQENGTIVISAPTDEYKAPSFDSTGTRYVTCVWVNTEKKDAPFNELKLLNLMLVQEGWSNVKNVSDMPRLSPIFYKAEEQAMNLKLNLFSGEPDPLFNYGDYRDISLLDVKREIVACLDNPNRENAFTNVNIRITGVVTGYANNILYLQDYFSREDGGQYEYGEYAGINFFTSMSSIPTKYTTRGAYISVCGVTTDGLFGFQVSGGSFPVRSKDENDAKVIIKHEDNNDPTDIEHYCKVFEMAPRELKGDKFKEVLYSPITLTENVTVVEAYMDDSKKITLTLSDSSGAVLPFQVYIAFNYKNQYGAIYSDSDFVGKKFKVNNAVLAYHKTAKGKIEYQLALSKADEFVEVSE